MILLLSMSAHFMKDGLKAQNSLSLNYFQMYFLLTFSLKVLKMLPTWTLHVCVVGDDLSSVPVKMNAGESITSHQLVNLIPATSSPSNRVPRLSVLRPLLQIMATSLSMPLPYKHAGLFFKPYHALLFDLLCISCFSFLAALCDCMQQLINL